MVLLKLTTFFALALAFALSLGAAAGPAAAQSAGNLKCNGCVNSKDIRNKGIKTKDIKDNAITGVKVSDDSLTGADIQDGSVGSADIADGSITGADLAAGAVTGVKVSDDSLTGADIQDGSVGSADIADGSITGADLAAGAVTADDILARTLVASPVGDGSDTTANGLALLDAIAFLGGVVPPPGAANPWLIKIEPGVFDLGTGDLQMREHVAVEGAGRDVTIIRGSNDFITGVVRGASNSEIRHLTVEHAGGTGFATAIDSSSRTNFRITDVIARIATPATQSRAISLTTSTATLRDVEATAEDAGTFGAGLIVTGGTTVTFEDSIVRGTSTVTGRGIFVGSCPNSITARGSVFAGSTSAIDSSVCTDGATELNFVASQLDGGLTLGGVALMYRCVGAYDENFASISATCN